MLCLDVLCVFLFVHVGYTGESVQPAPRSVLRDGQRSLRPALDESTASTKHTASPLESPLDA